MFKAAFLCAWALCLAVSCAHVKSVQENKPLPTAIPRIAILNDSTATALKISMLQIDVAVAANIATTSFEIHFYNPNDRVLEGEFEFPLADGQHVTRYALDINGKLREGVVVEKAKARVAFESTIRRKVDPGLVEQTKGNNYRTRIYPLPAKGYRKILIEVEQTLDMHSAGVQYQLPLYAKEAIDTFDIKVRAIKSNEKPVLDEKGIAMDFKKENNTYTASHHANNFTANHTITFTIPASSENPDVVLTENYDGSTYFYVNSAVAQQFKEKRKPATIGVLWDISGSAEQRDLAKEKELLKKYLSALGSVNVSLIPFNIYLQPKEDFTISGGNSSDLLKRIESLVYDGGTQLGAVDLSKYSFDEMLLFSDGLSTFGKEEMNFGSLPVTTITTSSSANYSYLKYIAQQTHGVFIDLGKVETTDGLEQLKGQSLQLVNISYNKADIEDLVTQITPVLNTGFSFAGKLKNVSAEVKLELGFGNEVVTTRTITITKPAESDYDQVKRIWATMMVTQLDMEYEKNKAAITKLGKQYSIVTQNTSLIVLDAVEDYVQHEITPPEELQKEYFSLLKAKKAEDVNQKEIALNEAIDIMDGLKEWWNTNYTVKKKQKNTDPELEVVSENFNEVTITDSSVAGSLQLETQMNYRRVGTNAYANIDTARSATTSHQWGFSVGNNATISQSAPPSQLGLTDGDGVALLSIPDSVGGDFKSEEYKGGEELESSINVNEWKAEAAYLTEIEKVAADKRMATYLALKKEHGKLPAFFVDMARFFLEKKENKLAIQVLSNVSEMKLENAELLRIVANQLMEANEKTLAIQTFEQILKIREEDPQSYRDLALACNENGEYNRAVELLYKVITQGWDSRFGEVKSIAINEMNAIISAHGGSVNTAAIDKRLIYAMPVDVRIVIAWNTDNSDMDLWVTDPRNEKCDYSHNETEVGGRLSQDVTQGFGPEEFKLKKAISGDYVIEVNLFGDSRQSLGGPTAIKADLYTDFGKPTQKRKTINFRVSESKEVVKIGALRFGS